MAARMGPLVLPRTPYAVSSARNNFKIDRYLNFSTGQVSDRYWGAVYNNSRQREKVDFYSSPLESSTPYFARALHGKYLPSEMKISRSLRNYKFEFLILFISKN